MGIAAQGRVIVEDIGEREFAVIDRPALAGCQKSAGRVADPDPGQRIVYPECIAGPLLVAAEQAEVFPAAEPVKAHRFAVRVDQWQPPVLVLPGNEFGEQPLQRRIDRQIPARPVPQRIGGGQSFGKLAKFGQIHGRYMPNSG